MRNSIELENESTRLRNLVQAKTLIHVYNAEEVGLLQASASYAIAAQLAKQNEISQQNLSFESNLQLDPNMGG